MESYRTIELGPNTGPLVHVAKKSKFIADAGEMLSGDALSAFVNTIREKHLGASHTAYACRAGAFEKYSDAGEPSGTAGLPLLTFLRGEGVTHCAITATRYFGGTLLGKGGLTHAYGACARLLRAYIVERVLHRKYYLTVSYPCAGRLRYALESAACDNACVLYDISYGQNVTFYVSTEVNNADDLIKLAQDAANGAAYIVEDECVYITKRP